MPGETDGIQGDDTPPGTDDEVQLQSGEDAGDLGGSIARTPIPPD